MLLQMCPHAAIYAIRYTTAVLEDTSIAACGHKCSSIQRLHLKHGAANEKRVVAQLRLVRRDYVHALAVHQNLHIVFT